MKTHLITSTAAAIVLTVFCASANAGPGPQVYAPIKTRTEAEALKPNSKIAITCPSCGAVSVSAVDKQKSHLHSFACNACKHTFEVESVAGGKATAARLVCKDTVTGKKMPLHMCAEMHK